jgi:hypothetical protein
MNQIAANDACVPVPVHILTCYAGVDRTRRTTLEGYQSRIDALQSNDWLGCDLL